MIYNLNPVQAYDLGLVKQIEVEGITADNNYNAAFIDFRGIQPEKKRSKPSWVYMLMKAAASNKRFLT